MMPSPTKAMRVTGNSRSDDGGGMDVDRADHAFGPLGKCAQITAWQQGLPGQVAADPDESRARGEVGAGLVNANHAGRHQWDVRQRADQFGDVVDASDGTDRRYLHGLYAEVPGGDDLVRRESAGDERHIAPPSSLDQHRIRD